MGNEGFILSGGSAAELVPINIDGMLVQKPASVATYYATVELVAKLDQLAAMLAQAIFRLDALHAHVAAREHAKARGQRECPICSGRFVEATKESSQAEVVEQAERVVSSDIDAVVSSALERISEDELNSGGESGVEPS